MRPADDPGMASPVGREPAGSRLWQVYRHSLTRFLAFSAFGLTFDLTVLALLDAYTSLPYQASVTLAFVLTYALNFMLNRWFAFDAAHGHVSGQLGRFLPQVAADYVLVVFGVTLLVELGLPLLPARVLSASTNAVLNYCAYRWWTFRDGGAGALGRDRTTGTAGNAGSSGSAGTTGAAAAGPVRDVG